MRKNKENYGSWKILWMAILMLVCSGGSFFATFYPEEDYLLSFIWMFILSTFLLVGAIYLFYMYSKILKMIKKETEKQNMIPSEKTMED